MLFKNIMDRFSTSVLVLILSGLCAWFSWKGLNDVNTKMVNYMKKEKKTFVIVGRDSYDAINNRGYSVNMKTLHLKSNDSIGELTIFVSDDVYAANLDKSTYTTRLSKKDIDISKGVESPYYMTISVILSICLILSSIVFFKMLFNLVDDAIEYFFE